MGIYFEDYNLGQKFETMSRTISVTEIVNFVTLGGFFEELFISDEAAKNTPYGKRISPGALVFVVAEGLFIQKGLLHDTALAFLGVSDMKLPAPVYCDDTVRVIVEIIEKRYTKKPGRGIVTGKHTVIKQDGEIVMEYICPRMVKTRKQGD